MTQRFDRDNSAPWRPHFEKINSLTSHMLPHREAHRHVCDLNRKSPQHRKKHELTGAFRCFVRCVLLEKIRICFIFKNSFTSQNKCQVLQWVPQNNTGTPSFRFCTDAQQSHIEKLSPAEAEGPRASIDCNALQSQCQVRF